MRIAAIKRNPINSPNMADKDFAILNTVAMLLRRYGFTVDLLDEKEYYGQDCYRVVYHMTRNSDTLAILEKAEAKGTIVINTASSVRQCERKIFTDILKKENILQPEYQLLEWRQNLPEKDYPFWFKKSDGWSCHPNDVCMITNKEEAIEAMRSFHNRGIDSILYCPHIIGDIIKFYGINNNFFRWHYPAPENSKFGLEKFNGSTSYYPFDSDKLHDIVFTAAKAIGIDIFGGDCIITPDGEIVIIDINDFPSFSMYCAEAAEAIVEMIIKRTKE